MKIKGYPLLNNVSFLYFVFFVSIINLFGFMYNKDYESVFLFSCTALIVYMFNNNMIVVLLISLIFVNLLIVLNKLNNNTIEEGFEDKAPELKKEVKEQDTAPELKDAISNITLGNIMSTLGGEDKNKEKNAPKNIDEDNKDSQVLTNKINKINKNSKVCDNSELIYSKINELNTKINDLTLLI
jgi:hypothetical protein